MDAVASIITTSFIILDEAKAFSRSVKQAQKRQEELQAEVSSTASMLDKLQDLVKEIGHDDPSDGATLAASSSSRIQSLLGLDDINVELQNLQKAVENVRTQLNSIKNKTDKEKSRRRLIQILLPEKGNDELQALLMNLRSIHMSVSLLTQKIPMYAHISRWFKILL